MTSNGLSGAPEDVVRRLRGAFHHGATYEALTEEAFDCLRRIAGSLQLSGFIDRSARQAIEHENGFLKFLLYEPPGGAFRLRLHVWMAQTSSPPLPDIHNHTRDYWSLVLAGRLRIEEFVPSAGGPEYYEYLASNRTPDRHYTFSYRGTSRQSITEVREVGVGQFHSATHAVFHRVSVLLFPACTLFLQGPERCSNTVVLCSQTKEALEITVQPPSDEQVAGALRSLVL